MPFDDFLKAQIHIGSRALLLNPEPISLNPGSKSQDNI